MTEHTIRTIRYLLESDAAVKREIKILNDNLGDIGAWAHALNVALRHGLDLVYYTRSSNEHRIVRSVDMGNEQIRVHFLNGLIHATRFANVSDTVRTVDMIPEE